MKNKPFMSSIQYIYNKTTCLISTLLIGLMVITFFHLASIINYAESTTTGNFITTQSSEVNTGDTFFNSLETLSFTESKFLSSFTSLPILETLEIKQQPKVTLLATGDIMFHSPQMSAAYDSTLDTYDFYPPFSKIMPYVQAADYALANFETTTSGKAYEFSGYPAFNAPDQVLDGIFKAGFDFLSTANNHAFDRKLQGVYRTLEQMDLRGFDHNGTFNDTIDTQRFIIKKVKGFKLGILSITYGLNGFENAYDGQTLYRNVNLITPEYDPDFVKKQLELMDASDVDASIVFVHWGNEYQLEPSQSQQILAQNLVLWGADIVLGSHPHVIQKSEILKLDGEDKYIIYSMGNFISNQSRSTLTSIKNSKYTEDGVMVYITLERSPDGIARLKEVKHIPTWVYKYKDNGKSKYLIIPTVEYIKDKQTLMVDADTSMSLSKDVLNLIYASYEQSKEKLMDYSLK